MKQRRSNVRVDDAHNNLYGLPAVRLTPDIVHATTGEDWWHDSMVSIACTPVTYGASASASCVTPTTDPVNCVACIALGEMDEPSEA